MEDEYHLPFQGIHFFPIENFNAMLWVVALEIFSIGGARNKVHHKGQWFLIGFFSGLNNTSLNYVYLSLGRGQWLLLVHQRGFFISSKFLVRHDTSISNSLTIYIYIYFLLLYIWHLERFFYLHLPLLRS